MYLPPTPGRTLEQNTTAAVRKALTEQTGSILVFLPGAREIRRVTARLANAGLGSGILIAPLFGQLTRSEQDRAIKPCEPGRRKVVLATSIAETSLTIEGIRVVVDAGQMRVPRFDVGSAMSRLQTIPVSKASADQRRGRAGRTQPGVCYRLWAEAAHSLLRPHNTPEIMASDLCPLALELFVWGESDPGGLAWIDPPPSAAFSKARELLYLLEAVDKQGRVTAHGRQMADLGLHPRLAHMVLKARPRGLGNLACRLAALLEERDILLPRSGARDADLRLRIEALAALEQHRLSADPRLPVDAGAARRVLITRPAAGPTTEHRAGQGVGKPDRRAPGPGLPRQNRPPTQRRRPALSAGRGPWCLFFRCRAALRLRLSGGGGPGRQPSERTYFPGRRLYPGSVAGDLRQPDPNPGPGGLGPRPGSGSWPSAGSASGASSSTRNPSVRRYADRVVAALLTGIRMTGLQVLPWTPAAEGLAGPGSFSATAGGPRRSLAGCIRPGPARPPGRLAGALSDGDHPSGPAPPDRP